MSKVKLVTSEKHRAERTVNIKGIEISFDAKLQTEVSEDHVETLMKADPSLSRVKKKEPKEEDKEPVVSKTEEDTDLEKEEDKGDEFDLKSMSFEDLKEMATKAELPVDEWSQLNQKKLRKYLTSKL